MTLETLRHSAAHLLAHAVKQLFPDAQVAIGPVIEDGFYYDFAFHRAFTPEDLEKIEERMQALAQQNIPILRKTLSREAAAQHFRALGEPYKVEIIESIPEAEALSLYEQADFQDLCRGPHVSNTGELKAFKLTRTAGAYWRGDSRNPMLQRIYGTAWHTQEALQDYLRCLEEAKERDHRHLGTQMDLFHFQSDAPGMVFWHPKGWSICQVIRHYLREKLQAHGYQEIHTPLVLARSLWEQSGHWDKFSEQMFTTQAEHREFAVKPMNCPGHVQVFNQKLRSYRELPLRFSEFGCCHRNEPSGSLHGLMRVRSFVQDDAHIFCMESQLQSEASDFIDLLYSVYSDFGFKVEDISLRLATRPQKWIGSEKSWDRAEQALTQALKEKGLAFELAPGEGAFYGPKIEFSLRDCLKRIWQCGTLQVDFSMPERLEATYVTSEGSTQTAIMLHRALLGALERFVGILLEHYAGKLPVWLAPVQIVVLTITEAQVDYAQTVAHLLQKNGWRVSLDLRNEKIPLKIREWSVQKVPFQLIIGKQEKERQTVSLRYRNGKKQEDLSIQVFESIVRDFVQRRESV